jgi:hypothetical protein
MPPCAFCGELADALCAWPVDRPESVLFTELRRGDRYLAFEGAKRPSEVVRVIPHPDNGEVEIVTEAMSYYIVPFRPVLRAVAGTCDAAICWRCAREVGEGKVYCRDHWGAWEKVA